MKQVEIVSSFDDKYVQHAAVMLVSLLKNTSRPVAFHFLVSDVKPRSMTMLQKLVHSYGSSVSFYEVDERIFGKVVLSYLVVQTYFRLLIPTLLHKKVRLLYLDVDMVFKGDVGELFDVDLEGKKIAAVADPGVTPEFISRISCDGRRYFNAGVMVMAVDMMSSSDSEKWVRYAQEEHSHITYHDQCVLNHFMEFTKISPRFNLLSQFLCPYEDLKNREYSAQEVAAAKSSPVVVHYNATFGKPWESHCTHPLKHDYLYYLLFTPWRLRSFQIILRYMGYGTRHRLKHARNLFLRRT